MNSDFDTKRQLFDTQGIENNIQHYNNDVLYKDILKFYGNYKETNREVFLEVAECLGIEIILKEPNYDFTKGKYFGLYSRSVDLSIFWKNVYDIWKKQGISTDSQ